MKTTPITDELLQVLFNYLNEKPRKEVDGLCKELERQFFEGNRPPVEQPTTEV